MNKKYVFSSLLFVSLLLTGCNSSSVIAMSAEEARDNIISNFTDVDPETLKYKFEGVSNIFNRSFEGAKEIYNGPGYEHRETTLQNFKASTTSNYLRILNHVNDSSWFAYKGSEGKSLNLEDEFYFIAASGSDKYVLNSSLGSELFKGNNGASYTVYPGVGDDNAFSFYNEAKQTFLAIGENNTLTEVDEIVESSSWLVTFDEAGNTTTILNIEHDTYHLGFDTTNNNFVVSETNLNNLSFYVTALQGRKTIDSSTIYGYLSRTFLISGSFAQIYIEETSGTLTKTLPASADPVAEEAVDPINVNVDVNGGMHVYLRNASCMITLYNCHYVDGWTELSSVWARWNVDLYFNNSGLLVYEEISSSNYPSNLNESIFVAGQYTYATK